MHSTAPDNNDSPRTAGRRAVGMPRQYGIRTMLVITTLYAAFFALLGCLEAPPAAFVLPGVFLAGIGLGQMLLFQGKRPREASLLVGSCSFVVAAAVGVVISHVAGERGDGVLLWMVVFTPALGAALGYLVGAAIAAPFLLAEWLKRRRDVAGQPPDCQPHGLEP